MRRTQIYLTEEIFEALEEKKKELEETALAEVTMSALIRGILKEHLIGGDKQ